MSKSIRDQLLGLGLKPKAPAPAKKPQKSHPKNPQNHKPKPAPKAPQPQKSAAAPNPHAQLATAQHINRQLAALFEEVGARAPEGEEKFSYVYKDKVRNIYLSPAQRQSLIDGSWAVTIFKAKSMLIPQSAIELVRAIDPARFVFHASSQAGLEDDRFAVPDDLMW